MTKERRTYSDEFKQKKFYKFIYYIFAFIFLGIDMTLKINYSFLLLYAFIGRYLLLEDKKKLSKVSILDYFLAVVVLPILFGIFFNFLFTN